MTAPPEAPTPGPAPSPAAAPPRGAARRRRPWAARELGVLLALALLVAGTASVNSGFLSAQSVRDVLLSASILALLAVGQTVVVVTRNIDLSVGSVLGLAAFATGKLFVAAPGAPLPLAVLAGVGIGALCGVVNGALVAGAGVPALVITLGMLYVVRGVDHSWAAGQQINAADMPRSFLDLGTATVLGVPVLALLAAAVLLVVGGWLRGYRSGREMYAIGSEPTAARLSGIPVGRRVFWAFVVSGALAGLAGVAHAARFGTVDATVGTGMELQVVAAVVVGGVAIFGGSGTPYGAALGALLLATIGSSLAVLRVDPFWQQAVVGALILAAIGLDRLLATRLAARGDRQRRDREERRERRRRERRAGAPPGATPDAPPGRGGPPGPPGPPGQRGAPGREPGQAQGGDPGRKPGQDPGQEGREGGSAPHDR